MKYSKLFKKKFYLGIQLLRLLLSFNIIVYHFLSNQYKTKIIFYSCLYCLSLYVPTFFLISFYFSYKTLVSKNIIKLKERLVRLFIPYIIWPLLDIIGIFLIYIINRESRKINLKIIFYQFLIGREINPPLYFQFNLIIITLLFLIIIFILKNYKNGMMILFIIIVLLHYFGYITDFFKDYSYIINHSVKKLFYSIIFSITGFLLGFIKLLEQLEKRRIISFFISFIFLLIYFLNSNILKIFQNLEVLVIDFFIINVFVVFGLIPFDLIENKKINLIIRKLTEVTGGIYYIHWNFGHIIINKIKFIKVGSFYSCIVNFTLCYIFCFFGLKLFHKTFLKYLFI